MTHDFANTDQVGGNAFWPIWIKFTFVSILFAFLLSYSVCSWKATWLDPIRPLGLKGEWIRSPGIKSSTAYFRKQINIRSSIRHAWISIAAKDGFEFSVNRNPVGKQYLWRPTRPFQNGGSEKGQKLSWQQPAMALNFPREYQWDGHDNWLLPTYIEFTNSLQTGKNLLCLEIESRSMPAAVSFYGEIVLWNGEVITIQSDNTWKSEPVPLGPQFLDWTEPGYWDKEWRYAQACKGPANSVLRSVPAGIYKKPFDGRWIKFNSGLKHPKSSFICNWNISTDIDEAWIRIVSNRRYQVFINDTLLTVGHNRPPDLDNGDWLLGRNTALDPVSTPELLDPDEAAPFFSGEKFENPRDAQADLNEFKNLKPKTHLPFRNYKTTNRAEDGGEFDPTRTLSESRRTPETIDLPAEKPSPNSLKRDRAIGGYLGYSIKKLLHKGANKIEIRPVEQNSLNWPISIAVDGQVTSSGGTTFQVPSPGQWYNIDAISGKRLPVDVGSSVGHSQNKIPAFHYRGVAADPLDFGTRFLTDLVQVMQVGFASIALLLLIAKTISSFRSANSSPTFRESSSSKPLWKSTLETLTAIKITGSITILCGILLETSFQERHEILWFHRGFAWKVVFVSTAFSMMIVGLVDTLGRCNLRKLRFSSRSIFDSVRLLPESRLWPHLIVWVLLFCALLRGYKLDLQPLDDDEYASTQAIMAILETGAPRFVPEDIYYTRSPLFHYVTAVVAFPFGGNLWSLRFQSVLWSVATVFMTYLCGSRLLGSRWIGFVSMVLLTIHPFQIYTGHVIRFYQMQQFFALLTVYLFCRGFVSNQDQRYRIATILVFLGAVLSQEISAVMGAPLVICYVMFAKDLGWNKNIQLIIFSTAAVLIVGLDLLAFKTLCLTRTEGVSPSIEAAISPHFWYPMNLFSIFIGYSRLHIIPSFFCLFGLPFFWKEKNRNAFAFATFLFSGVLMTNLLVSHVSLRYQYWLFPIWLLVSMSAIRLVLSSAIGLVYDQSKNKNRFATAFGIGFAIVFAAIILSWSPWRIPGTYEMRLLGDSTGCVRWVKSQMREGDKLAITEPHTHSGFLEAGKVDYDIAVPLLYDFAVFQGGRLIDRNGGGELINSVDDLTAVIEKEDRVWILVNREKFRTRGKNMRWEYPGARFETFIRKNCELKHRTYLWHAYLWDASKGHYTNFRKQE